MLLYDESYTKTYRLYHLRVLSCCLKSMKMQYLNENINNIKSIKSFFDKYLLEHLKMVCVPHKTRQYLQSVCATFREKHIMKVTYQPQINKFCLKSSKQCLWYIVYLLTLPVLNCVTRVGEWKLSFQVIRLQFDEGHKLIFMFFYAPGSI